MLGGGVFEGFLWVLSGCFVGAPREFCGRFVGFLWAFCGCFVGVSEGVLGGVCARFVGYF